ncbi:putative IQ motif, EF-hand binding protein [Helianthus annuus]|nr:putative IQ motif, EF-hand binding protein [Helianthus annuus]
MGKSPGKWIKTVLFGKKSSKSNLSKGATLDKKASINRKTQSKDSDADSMVISSPVPHVVHASGEHTELEKTTSTNLTSDTVEVVRSNLALNTANEDEFIRLEQAATVAQAACRGYLARRAIWAIKGITRLQAHIRGHLVRRQAVATLSCMRSIVEFQALTRGIIVRLSVDNRHVLQKFTAGELLDKKNTGLLKKSLRSEKLSTNAFGTKLVASSHSTMPLSIQYDPTEPNSARNWLDRWSTSYFWEPLPKPKRVPDTKPKRKQMKSQHEETEPARPKRGARRVSVPNLEGRLVNSSENEKSKPTLRKMSSQQKDSVQEQSHIELEKVKQSLRKISVSVSSVGPSEKPEIITENSENSLGTDQSFEKVNDLNDEMTILPLAEPLPVPPLEEDKAKPPHNVLQDNNHTVEIDPPEINGKESQKARRRKSFPVKEEHHPESVLQNTPTLPSYMAATESAKAKLRALALEDGAESGFVRRHSLPSSTGKLSLQSPRVQKPLQANVKGWSRSNKSQISARDDKMLQTGWKR